MVVIRLDLLGEFAYTIGAQQFVSYYPQGTRIVASIVEQANDSVSEYGLFGVRGLALKLPKEIARVVTDANPTSPYQRDWVEGQLTWQFIRYVNWLQKYLEDNPLIDMDDINYIETHYSPNTDYIHVTIM